jgi:hypothetical protein
VPIASEIRPALRETEARPRALVPGTAAALRPARRLALYGCWLIIVTAGFASAGPAASASTLFDARVDYNTGLLPRSVTSADFNGDDKPDLVTANNYSDSVSVLLGVGDGSFGTQTGYATGSFPGSVVSEDFNGDLKPDLAVANENADTVSILPGNGDGSFGAKTDFPTGATPISMTSGYFNADNHPDLATANFNSRDFDTDGTVSVLLGNGDGSFGAKTDFDAAIFYPSSVISADFNGDDEPDLAVGDSGTGLVSILPGIGDGTFGARTSLDLQIYPDWLTSGDFNGDQNPDLAATSTFSNSENFAVSVLLSDGEGSFGSPTEFTAGRETSSVISEDFNGDGMLDLATSNFGGSSGPGTGTVSVLPGDGSGGFGPRIDFTTGPKPNSVTSADFNSDGKPDLATSNHNFANISNVSVLLGNGVPEPVVAPTDLDFGIRGVGTTSSALTVTVTSPSVAYPLLIGEAGVTGPDADDFIIGSDNCTGALLLTSGSCEVGVSLAPSAAGDREAELEFSHNGSSSPLTVPLAGIGGVARIGKVRVSGPKKVRRGRRATYRLRISNSGDVPADRVKLRVGGRGVRAKKSVGEIAPGGVRTVRVRVKPKKPGRIKVSFRVTSGNAGARTVKRKITVRR